MAVAAGPTLAGHHADSGKIVANSGIEEQRQNLARNSQGKGFGPRTPRDIDSTVGNTKRLFNEAPAYNQMNLCKIHFHKNAEHKGGELTKYAGNGDGKGSNTGFKYSGILSTAELKPAKGECVNPCSRETL